jgi:large subunit ribosomal protein L21
MTIAVIKTGGKQYVVSEEKQLKIEKILGEKGDQVMFDEVLLVSDLEGKDLEVGQPLVAKKVSAEIMEQGRARKINVAHYKAKTRHYKVRGHRQAFTKIKITKIG